MVAKDELDDVNHETVWLSKELDEALNSSEQYDELDTSDFSVTASINSIFPTEDSLTSIDLVLLKLKNQIKKLDKEITEAVRQQTDQGPRAKTEIVEVRKSIMDLYNKIKQIKDKATQAEGMVQEITRDIKSLDLSKRNLTMSITVLKRLQMIVTAIEQLKAMGARKQYVETAQLIQAVLQLLSHFNSYKSIREVSKLFENVASIEVDLKKQIFSDFEAGFSGNSIKNHANMLKDACLVLDVIQRDSKKQLSDWYCEMQMREYRSLFKPNTEVSGLPDISRRYAWLKRTLKSFDDEHSYAFPPAWRVAEVLCEKFCRDTRKDIGEVLAKLDATGNIDVKVMLQAIQTTSEFEGKLGKRFDLKDSSDNSGGGDSNSSDTKSKFYKIISSVFEPYLGHYLESENKNIAEMFENYRNQPLIGDNANANSEEETVLPSSTDLFYFYRQTLVRFAQLSTGKPFLDMCKIFGKWLKVYAEFLLSKIPKEEKKSITEDEIRITCYLINTADYCSTTVNQLEEKLAGKINDEFKNLVTFSSERDEFINVVGMGIKGLVRGITNCVDPALISMVKMSWGTVESVGDQSEYVSMIATLLTQSVTNVNRAFGSAKYFRVFCDKFVEGFLTRYEANVYKCKPISEVGAEQMLLDTHALRTILVQMTNIGKDQPSQPPITFSKILTKGIAKVEMLLKTVMIPHDPADGLVDRYLMMFADDISVSGFQKILDLKNVGRRDQQNIIDVLQQKLSTGANSGNTLVDTSQQAYAAASGMNFASGAADAAKKSIAVGNAAAAATGTKIKDGAFKFFSRK